jgi:PRC-barrel domain
MSFKTEACAAALALALGVAAATAQQTAPQSPQSEPKAPVTGQIMTQPQETILAKDFIGQTVLAPDNSKIGNVSDLLLSKDGKSVEGFIVGVGGFLGIGERSVALKMDQLQIMPGADGTLKLVTNLKREELANAPAFKSRKDIEAEKRAAERPTQPKPGGGPGGGGVR